jgi:hypothetical protein
MHLLGGLARPTLVNPSASNCDQSRFEVKAFREGINYAGVRGSVGRLQPPFSQNFNDLSKPLDGSHTGNWAAELAGTTARFR